MFTACHLHRGALAARPRTSPACRCGASDGPALRLVESRIWAMGMQAHLAPGRAPQGDVPDIPRTWHRMIALHAPGLTRNAAMTRPCAPFAASPQIGYAHTDRHSRRTQRMRMLPAVLIAILAAVTPTFAQQAQHAMATPDDLKWVDAAPLPGAKMAVVNGNPGQEGLFVYRFKLPANVKIPPHFHKASESVTVLSGTFFVGLGEKFDQGSGKELPTGSFVFIPPTHPHFAWTGGQETIVQVHGYGPTDLTFVNPADDPRKK